MSRVSVSALSSSIDCPSDAILGLFVDGALEDEKRTQVLSHIESCEHCFRAIASASVEEHEAPVRPGDHIGRYDIVELLGAGAMGAVYRAKDCELGRDVALKVVHPNRRDDQSMHERLRKEARALAQVSSPYVVSVFDVGRVKDREETFVSMELIEGVTLRVWLEQTERSLQEITRAYLEAAQGLVAAHEKGVIHRDFKPDNVFVGKDGRVRVGDFGLARQVENAEFTGSASGYQNVTRGVGTPAYMAPEQRGTGQASALSDQYSFCLSLLEALTKQRPIGQSSSLLLQRVNEPIRSILERGLSTNPDQRFADMQEVIERLRPIAYPEKQAWGLRGVIGLGAVVVMIAMIGAIVVMKRGQNEPVCNSGGPEVEIVWNENRAAQLRESLAKMGDPGNAANAVNSLMNKWKQAWSSERDASCKATGKDDSLRGVCLTGQRERVDAFLRAVSEGNAKDPAAVVAAVQLLPAPTRCVGSSPTIINEDYRMLEKELGEAAVLRWTGEAEQAKTKLVQLLEKYEKSHPSFSLRAKIELGLTEIALGHNASAKALLSQANQDARRNGELALALDATIALVEALARDGERSAANLMGDLALAELQRSGADLTRESAIQRGVCLASERKDFDIKKLLELCKGARDLTLEAHGPDDFRFAEIENIVGDVLWRLGDFWESSLHYETALSVYERALGEGTKSADRARENIAFVWLETGDPLGAERVFREGLKNNPNYALGYDSVAMARRKVGDYAGEIVERQIALSMCLEQKNYLCQLWQRVNLGAAFAELGNIDESEKHLDLAEDLNLEPSQIDRAQIALARAQIAMSRGEHKRACNSSKRAYDLAQLLPKVESTAALVERIEKVRQSACQKTDKR